MKTTVTAENRVAIPAEISRKMGIKPGCRLEWQEPEPGSDDLRVRVIPPRAELAGRLFGSGRHWSPGRDAVAELVAERSRES